MNWRPLVPLALAAALLATVIAAASFAGAREISPSRPAAPLSVRAL